MSESLAPSAELPRTPFTAPAGSWTLAVLPDTQHYSASHPEVFTRITKWIAAHRDPHQIRFVAHEGDIVDLNTPEQWSEARKAMVVLDEAGIPWAASLGNHDLESDAGHPVSRATLYNDYFLPTRPAGEFGQFEPGRLENHWQTLDTPTGKFLILALEYGPRAAALAWANEAVAAHPDRRVIALIHEYLFADGTRFHWDARGMTQRLNAKCLPFAAAGDVADGEDIWRALISRHPNLHFVLCGHVGLSGAAHLASAGAGGQAVHQILANYLPARGYGGGGFIRLMRFLPDGASVEVKTYSPWYDAWLTEPDHDFTLRLNERLQS